MYLATRRAGHLAGEAGLMCIYQESELEEI
jgi:hypothetical protein